MSWSNDTDPQDDFEFEGDDPELEGDADNPEDEAVEARARELAQQYAQEQINEFRGQYGKRWNTFNQVAPEWGISVGEDGRPVITDPSKFASVAQQLHGQQAAAQPATPQAEEIPDQITDPAGFNRWLVGQIDARARELMAPLQQENQRLLGTVSQGQFGPAFQAAQPVLENYGLGEMGATTEYRKAFQDALNSVPVEQWNDPLVVEMAAMTAIPLAKRALGEGWQPGTAQRTQDPQQLLRQASRVGLSQSGTSRGGRSDQPQYTAEVIEAANLAGMPPAEFLAFSDPTGKAAEEYLAKQERAAARRRN